MASYLLLRSNKESGPYELNDLVQMGLRAYDLVWVKGKSAAWRYPSEIEELRAYAPAVEEQPYDRFYKKNTHETKEEPVSVAATQPSVAKQEEQPVAKQPEPKKQFEVEEKYEKYIPKKSVFVTMPGQKSVSVQKPAASAPVPTPPPADPVPTITVTENPAAQIKYSQPLDEIKEMYVKTLHERKNKIARKSFLIGNLKKAAVVIGLVAIGILGGFALRPGSKNDQKIVDNAIKPVQSASLTGVPEQTTQPESLSVPQNNNDQQSSSQLTATETKPLPPAVQQRLMRQETQDVLQERNQKPVIQAPVERNIVREDMPSGAVESNPSTGERSRRVRNESQGGNVDEPVAKTVMSKARKSGLENQVSVTSNDYKRVAFGGIRNLELTVTNESRHLLDKVTVELQYLKPSEEPLKTELIQFRSISPNGSLTMRIRDTNRGIKVLYKIIDIQSAQQETAASGF
jgi:hypothetical protein